MLHAHTDKSPLAGGTLPRQVTADHLKALVQIRETGFECVLANDLLDRSNGECELLR